MPAESRFQLPKRAQDDVRGFQVDELAVHELDAPQERGRLFHAHRAHPVWLGEAGVVQPEVVRQTSGPVAARPRSIVPAHGSVLLASPMPLANFPNFPNFPNLAKMVTGLSRV